LRIAQVAPLYESVPPKYYGGTERIVSYLTEELVHQGHNVTLFASGDSITKARLIAPCRQALRLDKNCIDQMTHHVLMLEQVFRDTGQFDIIHFHIDYLHFPLSKRQRMPHVTTLHGRLDIPDLVPLYKEFHRMPVVSISDAQRKPLPCINWQGTVYHGLPEDLYTFREEPGKYLAFLGRISPEKRVDRAIRIARKVGIEIKIAAKIDNADREYFEEVIKPLLNDPLIEYVGEIGEGEKDEFLGNAYAFLFPIDWPEPFGMVMIEAMACGAPVIAYRQGSIPEVIEEGATGFIVENLEEAVKAVERVSTLSRKRCRQVFEERFSVTRMARDYMIIYNQLVERKMESRAM
jgi:glycosyltransferase involved in cell wall biosynthesis